MVTAGIEIEFKTAKVDAAKCKAKIIKAADSFDFRHGFASHFDHCSLVEMKTGKIPVEEFSHDLVCEFRDYAGSIMADMGIDYLYYGFHVSIWNFDESDEMIPAANAFPGIQRWVKTLGEWSSDNIYEDPFVDMDGSPDHAIVHITNMEGAFADRSPVWLPGRNAALRFFALRPDILDLTNCGPVQGGAIRIEPRSRVEAVLGWLDPVGEKLIVDSLVESAVNPSIKPADPPLPCFGILSQRSRMGIVMLNKHSFNSPPKEIILPDNLGRGIDLTIGEL